MTKKKLKLNYVILGKNIWNYLGEFLKIILYVTGVFRTYLTDFMPLISFDTP